MLLIKKSLRYSFSTIAGLSTVAGLWGYTVKDINPLLEWWKCGLLLLASFVVLSSVFFCIFTLIKHKPYKTMINGKPVTIKEGNLFSEDGWKVIPFNDRFDTKVDDVVIAHNSLNGKMIDEYVKDISCLKQTISNAFDDKSKLKPIKQGNRIVYPLGRLIPFDSFLMLSFSHFDDQNRAFIGIGEYEQMLICMWSEMRRVYAAKKIAMPFIGTGITTIEGVLEKNYTEMLKCILCTLRSSKFQPEKGITIVLTKEALKKVDMNIIKEEF